MKIIKLIISGIFLTLLMSSCKDKNQNVKADYIRPTTENYNLNITAEADTVKTYYNENEAKKKAAEEE